MQLRMELTQKQTLNLTLSPELHQSIHILQFSAQELVDFLHQKAMENPLLEIKEKADTTYQYGKISAASSEYNPLLNYSNTDKSLEQHLMEQVMTLPDITPMRKKIVKFLIGNLNQYGFLEIEPAIAARIFSISLKEIDETIKFLQSLDPIGVGARNLTDCLLIQIRSSSKSHPLSSRIVENHLQDLAKKNYRKIAKSLNASLQEVQEAEDFIKTLNPRPCSEYNDEMIHYIAPDVIVKPLKNQFAVTVNDSMLPELSIEQLCNPDSIDSDGAADFLKEKYHEAMALMQGISQRKRTLQKVACVIAERQQTFLHEGLNKLKPMILKDIAEELGCHESTISRAINNKYIQTPQGLFKLKSLFTSGINRTEGLETDSSAAVKSKIKAIIAGEIKQKPYSDQQLVHLLEKNGILISRRTVAKYREEMGIPGSSKRKRF